MTGSYQVEVYSICLLTTPLPDKDTSKCILNVPIADQPLTYYPKHGAEHNSQQHKPRVPIVVVVHRRHTEEHEDDGFR